MKNIISVIVILVMTGCTTFTEQPVITEVPNDIKDRNNYLPTAQWKYELTELAGSVLVKYKKADQDGKLWDVKDRIIKSGTEPQKTSISDGELLTRLVDNRADAKLKAIGIGGASLSNKQKMEFTFSDARRVFIPSGDFDREALKKEAEKPLKDNEEAKYYVRGALLSVIQRRIFTEIEGSILKNIATSGLKADGKLYNSETNHTKDFAIHLTLISLSDFGDEFESSVDEFNSDAIKGLWIDL